VGVKKLGTVLKRPLQNAYLQLNASGAEGLSPIFHWALFLARFLISMNGDPPQELCGKIFSDAADWQVRGTEVAAAGRF